MSRCDNYMANKVCDHNRFGFENCESFIPKYETSDVLYDLKHKIHDKAVRPHSTGIDAYVNLKTFDAVLKYYIEKYKEGHK